MRRLLHVAMTRARRRLVLVHPQASDRGAAQPPSPFAEEARLALGAEWEERAEELFGPDEIAALDVPDPARRAARDDQADGIALGELRFDTDLDVSHAVVRYLEVREAGGADRARARRAAVADALDEVNARIAQAIAPEQREIFQSIVAGRLPARRRSRHVAPRGARSPRARSRRWSRSCRAAARGSC